MSDSHLGYFRFNITNNQGVNQRMMDFHDAFLQAVDLAIEAKPNFILHSGDIVDSANPPNRSRNVLRHSLRKISKAKIPMVVLSGTHDVPKTRRDSHLFELFNYPNIHMISEPDKVSLDIEIKAESSDKVDRVFIQKVNVFCVPYSTNFYEMKAWFDDTIAEPIDDSAYNILMLHCDIFGIAKLEHGYNVLAMPEDVADKYDYVALGHFHTSTIWKGYKNVMFAGAMERKNFDEVGESRYIHQVIMGTKDGEPVMKVKGVSLKIRDMAKIVVDLSQVVDLDTAYDAIRKQIAVDIMAKEAGAVIQVVLRCNYDLYRSLNLNYIKEMFPNALYVESKRESLELKQEESPVKLDASSNIIEEWKKMVNSLDEPKEEKKWLWQTGKEKLEEVMS